MSRFDALVDGRSLPALAAALDLAELGLRVIVAGDSAVDGFSPGASGTPGTPEAPERDLEGAIAELLRRVSEPLPGGRGEHAHGERAQLQPQRVVPAVPLLRDGSGAWQPQPEPNVWGIPTEPIGPRVSALIGGGGAFRAYRDRIAPLLTVGKTSSLGRLIRKRMGGAVLSRLSEPLLRERYGVSADAVDVAIAAPGLNEALTRAGSLSSAASTYLDRHAEREALLLPAGGWAALHEALVERLGLYGAEFSPSPVVEMLENGEDGWNVRLADGEAHEVRAVVLDRSAEGSPSIALRIHAEIDIEASGGLDVGHCGLLQHGEWTLRVHGSGRAEARGPRGEQSASDGELDAAGALSALDELLVASGAQARAGAAWRIERRAAPYATLEERELAAEALDASARRTPTALEVGRALHGDDLSAALAAGHRGAVVLRRRLLGIADGE